MSLDNFILECEKDNEKLRKEIEYYKNQNKRLKQENNQLRDDLEETRKVLEDTINERDMYYEIKPEWRESSEFEYID